MLGIDTTRPQPDAPDRADDLVGYLRRGPRQLPPGIPAAPVRRPARPVVPALVCVTALAALLVGCQIVKQPGKHTASPSPSTGRPSSGHTGALPSPRRTSTSPSPRKTSASPPHRTSPAPGHVLPALPASSSQLARQVTRLVFAERTVRIRVDVQTPQAHTLRETLAGTISVAPDGTLTGTASGTADRINAVHVQAPFIFLPRQTLFVAPPAKLMPAGKTWARITPADPNGRASYAARQAAYVLYASATSWSLIRFATHTTRPRWHGAGSSATADMSGTVALDAALPHATPGARDAVITFAGPGTKHATWRVVLDRRLLPRKCIITARSPTIGPITAVVTYSGWGTPVHATAPPADSVAAFSQLPPYLREVSQ